MVYFLEPSVVTNDLRRQKITVHDYADGTIAIRYNDPDQTYSTFDKVQQVKQADIVSNKRLSTVLELVKEEQERLAIHRSQRASSRLGQQSFRRSNPTVFNPN